MALRRGEGDVAALDVGIIERHLLGLGVLGHEGPEERGHRQPGGGEGAEPRHEGPAIDDPVSILVVPVEGFLWDDVGGGRRGGGRSDGRGGGDHFGMHVDGSVGGAVGGE